MGLLPNTATRESKELSGKIFGLKTNKIKIDSVGTEIHRYYVLKITKSVKNFFQVISSFF